MVISVHDMLFTALFTAVLCAVAPFSIVIGPIPLSAATLVIYLAGGALGWKLGGISVLLYVAIGAVGLPVFSNFEGGFHKIVGLTGGFIVGYIPCAIASGLFSRVFSRKIPSYAFGMVIGTLLLYTCGVLWFMSQTGSSLAMSLALCVTPFLPGDTIKIIIACIAAPKLFDVLNKVQHGRRSKRAESTGNIRPGSPDS